MAGPARMHQLSIVRTTLTGSRPLDLDGMSGGAIFSIDGKLGNYKTYLRGLIMRGGNDYLYMIDATFLRQMIGTIDGPTFPNSTTA
jgi:hypothetical protein